MRLNIERLLKIKEDTFIEDYLYKTFKRSTGSYFNNKSILRHFLKYVKKNVKDITIFDIMDYFENSLDKLAIKKNTKNTRRYTLKSFFNYIRKQYIKSGKEYTNPVPDKDIFEFSRLKRDIVRQSQKILPILSHEDLELILDYIKPPEEFNEKSYRNYLLFLLVIVSGARISEIRTIQVNEINLPNRYFESGFIKDARKTTLKSEESLLFFFPKGIIPILEKYILNRKHSSEFLFYSPRDPTKPMSHALAGYISRTTSKEMGVKFSWHYFRRTIITGRIKMGCSEGLSEGLANHIGKSVEWESYIKLNINERREQYDKYFPYQNIEIFK